jgi:hypothetical protein
MLNVEDAAQFLLGENSMMSYLYSPKSRAFGPYKVAPSLGCRCNLNLENV